MEKFISYFLTVNFLVLLQVAYYRLFLARQRRFLWNRIYLLGGIAAALLLPLVHWEIVPPSLPNPSFVPTLPEIVIGPAMPASPAITAAAPAAWSLSAAELALAVYGIGVLASLTALAMRNFFILRLIWKGQKTKREGYTLVATSEDIGPASYFRYIFWNAGHRLDPQCTAVAMAHERCHSRQFHSIDLLAVELMKAFCWVNPAIYLLRKDLRKTHEFLADQAALEVAGPDGITRLLLLRQLGSRHLSIANYFHSHIKARMMMLKENPKRKTILHYILIAPLAGLMVACTSLAHPVDGQLTAAPVDDKTETAQAQQGAQANPEIFSIEDMFIKAGLPLAAGDPNEKGIVCLGRQPQVLNLDSVVQFDELKADESQPKLLNRDRIVKLIGYPKEAQERKLVGKVVVKVLVDATGHVIRYQFLQENDPVLRDAVAEHVEELLFKPGTEEGKPSEWWVVVPFAFGMPGC